MTTAMFSPRQIEILDELSVIVTVEGFRNLTVADLADRLRCSRRTLYTLAPSRDDLIVGVVERLFERWTAHADAQAASSGTAIGSILAYLESDLFVCDARPIFFDDVSESEAAAAVHRQHRTDRLGRLRALIAGTASDGLHCHDVDVVAELLDAVVERLRAMRQQDPPAVDAQLASKLLRDAVECWLRPAVRVDR